MHRSILILSALFLGGCAFKTPLVASMTADGKYWILKEPLEYEMSRTKRKFIVPKGFVTDLASVPRAFWIAFPPCGKYTPAAVVHDYLYWIQHKTCDKSCADEVLLSAMEESHVNLLTRTAIHTAAKVAGWDSWNKNAISKAAGSIRFVPDDFPNIHPSDTWETIEQHIKSRPAISPKSIENVLPSASQVRPPTSDLSAAAINCDAPPISFNYLLFL